MDIGSAFTYVFDDEEWVKKLAIGGGIALAGVILSVVLVGLLLFIPLLGYMIETLKNVRDGQPRPLPEWTDFGGFFRTGLAVFGINIVYFIPVILLSCATGVINALPGMMELDSDAASAVIFLSSCVYCFQFLISLVVNALLPAAFIRYAQFGTFGSAFQFGEIFSFIRANLGDYIIAVLLAWVAGFIAGFGILLCVIGVFFTFFWSMLVQGHLYGQLARRMQMV